MTKIKSVSDKHVNIKLIIIVALATAFCVVIAYSPILNAGWVYDDANLVKPSPAIRDFSGFIQAISTDLYRQASPRLEASSYWRPVALFSMWFDTRFTDAPFSLHFGNLFWLSVAILLLVLVFMRYHRDRGKPAIIAACVAAVWWGLHPQNVESVAWISCRYELLWGVALLGLMALSYRPGIGWAILYGLIFLAGLLSKESFLSIILVVAVVEFVDKRPVRQIVYRWLAIAGALVIWMTARAIIGLKGLDAPTSAAVLSMIKAYPDAIGIYAGRILPFAQLTISHPYAVEGIGIQTIVGIVIFIALIGVSIKFSRLRIASAIFLATLIPAAGAMVMFHESPERYFYVPSIGLALLLGELLLVAISTIYAAGQIPKAANISTKKNLSVSVCAIIGIAMVVGIVFLERRLPDWKNDYALWTSALMVNPRDPQANFNVGVAAGQHGDWGVALKAIRMAAQLDTNSGRIANAYAWSLIRTGDYEGAVREARRATKIAPFQPDSWYYLVFALHKSGDHASELNAVKKLLEISPEYPRAREMLEIAIKENAQNEQSINRVDVQTEK